MLARQSARATSPHHDRTELQPPYRRQRAACAHVGSRPATQRSRAQGRPAYDAQIKSLERTSSTVNPQAVTGASVVTVTPICLGPASTVPPSSSLPSTGSDARHRCPPTPSKPSQESPVIEAWPAAGLSPNLLCALDCCSGSSSAQSRTLSSGVSPGDTAQFRGISSVGWSRRLLVRPLRRPARVAAGASAGGIYGRSTRRPVARSGLVGS